MPLLETTPDHFNPPVHHDALEDPAFAAESERRSIARLVSVKGDSNERLRQALLRRHRILRMPLANSKSCHHWRESGAPRIKKTQVARTSHGTRQSLGHPGSCTSLHTCDPRRLQNAPAQGRKPQRSKSPHVRQRSTWTCHTSPHTLKMSTQMTVATRRKLHPAERNRHQKKPLLQVVKLIQKMSRHNQQHRTLTARLYPDNHD